MTVLIRKNFELKRLHTVKLIQAFRRWIYLLNACTKQHRFNLEYDSEKWKQPSSNYQKIIFFIFVLMFAEGAELPHSKSTGTVQWAHSLVHWLTFASENKSTSNIRWTWPALQSLCKKIDYKREIKFSVKRFLKNYPES